MADRGYNQISGTWRGNYRPLKDNLGIENTLTEAPFNKVVIDNVDEFHSYGAQNTEAQALDKYEAEIVPDSEDEGTHEGEVLAGTSLLSSCQIDGHTETNTMAVDTKQRILCNSCTAENAFCIEGKGPLSSTKNRYAGSDTMCETYKTCYDPAHKDDIQSPKGCQCVTDSSILNASHVYDNLELNEDINLQAACTPCSLEDLDREQKQRSPSRYCENMGFGAKSQGPDELSLAESLGFVDQYLSAHFEDVAPWAASVVCEKSQYSVSNAKGPQSLVSLASLANFKSRVIEDSRKHNYQSLPGCKDLGQILQRRFMSVEDMDLRKQRIYPPVREVTDQCSNISEKLRDTSISSGSMPLSGVTRTCYDVLRPKLESGKVSLEELDMLLNKKSYSSKLEASVEDKDADVYEVGISTQIAAEAMEALYYADPPNDAHLHPADTSDRLANVTTQILCSEVVSIQNSSCSKPVDHKKPGACSKNQRWKSSCSLQDSNSAADSCQEPAKKRRTHRELSTSSKKNSYPKNSTSLDHYSGGAKLRTKGNLKGVVQCKSKRNIRKKVVYSGNSERQCEKFIPLTRGGRQSVPSKSLKLSRTSDGNCQNGKVNLKVEDDVPCKKRKTMVSIADNSDVSKQRKNSLKVSFETSSDGRNGSISQGDAKQLERDAILNLQNFNVLDYPRGKRTSRVKMGSRGRGGGFIYPVKLLNMNECNMAGSQTQGMLESKSDSVPSCFRCPIKRKKRTSIHRTISISIPGEQSCGNLHGKNVDELGQIDIVHEHNSIVKGEKVVHVTSLDMGMDQFKNQNDMKSSSSLCLRKDSVSRINSSNIVNGASFKCRMSIDELHAHNTISSHGKQPDKRRKSSSLLTKELSRLGCIDSMPDFTSKDLRRRRTMASIQVLLSQNLKKDIFKQQKKILAWFGVSMASCPSDATHFIADKFTRTRNMLEIIALGKPVVTPLWLESCKEAGFCIDERKYFLRDVKKERELGFSLPDSLIQAGQQPLLRGYKVSVTRNVKPAQEVISSLVKTLHGELVEDPAWEFQSEDEKIVDSFLILSCEEDYADCIPFLQKGATAYASELLLNGVVIQKLEFQRHKLFFSQSASN